MKVTEQRTARDFAQCMRDLVEVHYPKAEQIRVVLDNLSTHSTGALYEAFPAPEAHRILRRLEFHYTPKHASWLNMVEIEIGVLRGQCLDRRIGERDKLVSEIAAWERQRNNAGARINWMFSTEKASTKAGACLSRPSQRVIIPVHGTQFAPPIWRWQVSRWWCSISAPSSEAPPSRRSSAPAFPIRSHRTPSLY